MPLQDHLLEGLEGEGPVDPALADGIANGLEVARLDEVPQRHAVGVGHREAVPRILGVAARDGEQAAVVEGEALALQRSSRGPGNERKRHGQRHGYPTSHTSRAAPRPPCRQLSGGRWPKQAPNDVHIHAGGAARPSSKPQQTTLPSDRSPQVVRYPMLTAVNAPAGGDASPSSFRPQQATV